MYQFTTETIINSALDSNGVLAKYSGANGVFKVSRVGNFNQSEIVSCFKNPYVAPVKEKIVRTVAINPTSTKVYRLLITLKRQDSYVSDYANDMSYNALQKIYEVTGVSSAAALVTAFYNAIVREARIKDNVYITPTDNGSAKLTLEVVDEYTHFVEAVIQEVSTATSLTGYDTFTNLENLLALAKVGAGTDAFTQGVEGFGTVKQITKNLRLPTLASTNWTAINQEEKPVAGGQYTQYSLKLRTIGSGGLSAVGQEVVSITSHIFYVLSTLVSGFEAALVGAGIAIDTVGTAVTAVTITSGNLDISNVVGGTAYQITYTTTPSGVTGAIFTLNSAASTVAGTADWTKVVVTNGGEITLVTGHGLAGADKIAVDVMIDGYTVTKEITLQA